MIYPIDPETPLPKEIKWLLEYIEEHGFPPEPIEVVGQGIQELLVKETE